MEVILQPENNQETQYEIDLSDQSLDPEWDAFLARAPSGSHFQISRWAVVKRELGWQVLRVKVHQGDQLIGGAQILIRRIPLLGGIGVVSRGPVISKGCENISHLVIDALRKAAKQNRIQYLLVQPPFGSSWLIEPLKEREFLESMVSAAPSAVVIIDLVIGEDTLFNNMTSRVQRYVRSAVRKGITIREAKEHDLHTFLKLLHATAAAKGWSIFKEQYYQKMWQTLHPTHNVRLTIATWREEDIAALLVYAHGEHVYGKTLVRTGLHDNSGAHELLLWESIKWSSTSGYRIYDLSRIDPYLGEKYSKDQLTLEHFTGKPAFSKLKLGGKVVLCPEAYTYLYNPWLRTFYRATFRMFRTTSAARHFAWRVRGFQRT